jgi:hypothetical protein
VISHPTAGDTPVEAKAEKAEKKGKKDEMKKDEPE